MSTIRVLGRKAFSSAVLPSRRAHATCGNTSVAAVTTVSCSTYTHTVVGSSAVSPAGVFQHTRLLRRPQTIKPNPNEATSGQFDKSFEKITETIESRLPFRQRHVAVGNIYDANFGEKSEHDMYKEAEEDLLGKEKEKPAARQARSYFSDEDLSPEALHVRSPHLKVAQNIQRQQYDPKILKTTAEASEYYYPALTKEQQRKRNAMLAAGWGTVGIATFVGLRKAGAYMRTAG
ncbi:hypothetical protein ABB37_00265 [Leptomonas pyrrhocoris]|uniref:Uncharacterized protein n=1 Tax=Leptomonas pyrrhocoris TaxID=157538 RepID=A0A0M9G9Z9_LEPPY|nr:hypothetical protein ABB37_00265 [Leptomonas pyrrhocoris]KPA85970.1 hypothetical protein ABB37_00265 [Leptomonas pyrrhocoris]|eukprot:XP_015664409.1 hypothetical protein ABB37_00265 [Leptomonas pyrrhocoris]